MAATEILELQPHFENRGTESVLARRAEVMHKSALFAGLTREECRMLALSAKRRVFARDEFLFMQGETIRSVMLIESGTAKLSQVGHDGSEVILWMNTTGDAIGTPSEARQVSHTCSARAVEKCGVLAWERQLLKRLMQAYPAIRGNIDRIVTYKLRELEERFRELATATAPQRLANTLLRLSKAVGKEHIDGIHLALSRDELAKMTGLSMFTTSRVIAEWGSEGVVLPRREAVVILSPRRLAAIAI